MCGRFDFDARLPEIRQIVEKTDLEFKTGEVFPTDRALVLLLDEMEMKPDAMVWGFPQFGRKSVVFNARAETALDKPMFRKPLLQHRIVVPTTGFYEWKAFPGTRKKVRFLFREPGKSITWLAGFYNRFRDGRRFTLLTTEANDGMADYHDRMPVVLQDDERLDWLKGNDLNEYLTRIPPGLEARQAG